LELEVASVAEVDRVLDRRRSVAGRLAAEGGICPFTRVHRDRGRGGRDVDVHPNATCRS